MLSDAIDFQFAKGADACAHTSPPNNDSNNDDDNDDSKCSTYNSKDTDELY